MRTARSPVDGEPDSAAIVAAIEACTGARCELNVGKPDPVMLQTALNILGLPARNCLMVGDRLYTDIAMAVDAGLDSALVLGTAQRWSRVCRQSGVPCGY